ncbi:MAG: hypothetical protein AAGF12_16205 [Myxococcota bacterium]
MRLLAFEERWAVAVCEGFAPQRSAAFAIQPGEVDYRVAVRTFLNSATKKAALGLRLAVWIAALAPLFVTRRLRTMRSLAGGQRALVLRRLLNHPWFVVRELTLLLKVTACMAIFRVEAVRKRTRYDGDVVAREDIEESGERPRHRLPVLSSGEAA